MTWIEREKFPCVRCDHRSGAGPRAPQCEEHLMWNGDEPAPFAERGWLDADPVHLCPDHRTSTAGGAVLQGQRVEPFVPAAAPMPERRRWTAAEIAVIGALVVMMLREIVRWWWP